jgi:hypothetical protein
MIGLASSRMLPHDLEWLSGADGNARPPLATIEEVILRRGAAKTTRRLIGWPDQTGAAPTLSHAAIQPGFEAPTLGRQHRRYHPAAY